MCLSAALEAFLYQSVGLGSVSCHCLGFGTEHRSKGGQKKKTQEATSLVSGGDLLQ